MKHQDAHFPEMENIGKPERIIRAVVGAAMIEIVLLYPNAPMGWLTLLPMVALYPAFTAIFGWDPFYALIRQSRIRSAGEAAIPHLRNNPSHQEQQEHNFDKAA